MQPDYRSSHMAPKKGDQYHNVFSSSPWLRYVMNREREHLLDIVEQYCSRRHDYLDFACGTARILRLLASHFKAAVGVDVSTSMLAVARTRAEYAIIEGDITRDERLLGSRRFDLITAFRFFPNAQPQLRKEAISALVNHLADDGVLVFNNHQNSSSTLLRATRALRKQIAWTPMHHDEVLALVQAAELHVIETRHIGVLPANERRMLVPTLVHTLADTLAIRAGVSRQLAQNIIYVCRRRRPCSPQHQESERGR